MLLSRLDAPLYKQQGRFVKIATENVSIIPGRDPFFSTQKRCFHFLICHEFRSDETLASPLFPKLKEIDKSSYTEFARFKEAHLLTIWVVTIGKYPIGNKRPYPTYDVGLLGSKSERTQVKM
ncbi:uncharacterized protein LOC113464298 isoform X2 [Ceratina calcarata]|uniref:Uncharacterized protein LOC113464298 isoform X2 n=1 Tax=Ceratina calcarata TaxID=156304 RepID=A0AAJ7WAL5_9HYME|nr:uncharacterized protein LOC113464298 isoform X2 [Ceratina calcarata]